jgi:hypothetical protein
LVILSVLGVPMAPVSVAELAEEELAQVVDTGAVQSRALALQPPLPPVRLALRPRKRHRRRSVRKLPGDRGRRRRRPAVRVSRRLLFRSDDDDPAHE